MDRKPKHLLQYKGPAFVIKRLSDTTYRLEFEGRKCSRCFSELRPYKSDNFTLDLPIATHGDMQLVVGNYVALCDSADREDDHLLPSLQSCGDGDRSCSIELCNLFGQPRTARFSIMYQTRHRALYTTEKPRINARSQEVINNVNLKRRMITLITAISR